MASEREPAFLLSNKYDPASDSPSKFRQAYHQLAQHRDDLRTQCEAKERKRADMKQAKGQSYNRKPSIKHSELTAAAAPKTKGSRFSNLADNSDGSTIAPPTKHKPPARLTTTRLEELTDEERKQEEKTREAAAAESKKKRAREEEEEEEVKKKEEKQDEEAKEEGRNEASEIELGQGWETVKRAGRR
ncbi:MAG: hypothetical protein ASARMPRED_007451 [Alectoria sarmentosa]|nr:MAG: hypothetical protein ASARMPRED_007451 [Alectoria sarmentosa]